MLENEFLVLENSFQRVSSFVHIFVAREEITMWRRGFTLKQIGEKLVNHRPSVARLMQFHLSPECQIHKDAIRRFPKQHQRLPRLSSVVLASVLRSNLLYQRDLHATKGPSLSPEIEITGMTGQSAREHSALCWDTVPATDKLVP